MRVSLTSSAGLGGAPSASAVEFPVYLDRWVESAASMPLARLEADLAFFEAYYFSVNNDPARGARLQEVAARARTPADTGAAPDSGSAGPSGSTGAIQP